MQFKWIGITTIVLVYLLILVGGIVRGTGAGMGCPDWPKCFDNWVPPSDVSQLPDNYQEIMLEKRKKKNEKLNRLLSILGVDLTDERSANQVYEATVFNHTKAWIEYVNRVIGVLIGFSIFLTTIASRKFISANSRVFVACILSFILVLFQGYLGSVVVSTNLFPGLITFHMAVAILIVLLLIYAVFIAEKPRHYVNLKLFTNRGSIICLALFLFSTIQVLIGTQVREVVDMYTHDGMPRAVIANSLENHMIFLIHRSFSWLILLLSALFLYTSFKFKKVDLIHYLVFIFVIIEAIVGITLAYFGLPAISQPIHLLVGTLIIGLMFYVTLNNITEKVE